MSGPSATASPALRRRLLADIAEVQQNPYPNVHLIVNDEDITHNCLILTPPEEEPLHLEIRFPDCYPLAAPSVTIQSHVDHPNVFTDYICATILNTEEGWTPAYTLRGILIQLLSLFLSDTVEQIGGGTVNIKSYKARSRAAREMYRHRRHDYDNSWNNQWTWECYCCGFNEGWTPPEVKSNGIIKRVDARPVINGENSKHNKLFELPDEVVLKILAFLDGVDIMAFSEAVPPLKNMLTSYDVIRIRELQCFCLKKSFFTTKLGIGVSITGDRKPVLRSEFDLLSNEAYNNFDVRKSIQGVKFDKWLPLPLSRRHWKLVRNNASHALEGLRVAAKLNKTDSSTVLFHMMNTVVVQFSNGTNQSWKRPDKRSTLSHASDKAIESYFALFHLLLCLATEDASIVENADRMVARFIAGPRTKTQFPDLGHLLVAALISKKGLTQELIFCIIKEAILRNVVWLLDDKGAGMAELAYLEPSDTSDFRLQMTFKGSRTSYRLLMFLKLFNSAARRPGKTLVQLREELFDTHGAPPPGVSATMASAVRAIRSIDSFPKFLAVMGITNMPGKPEFTAFLRRTITNSLNAGYSVTPMSQSQLYMIRRIYEPNVERNKEVRLGPELEKWFDRGEKWYGNGWNGRPTFFPNWESQDKSQAVRRRR